MGGESICAGEAVPDEECGGDAGAGRDDCGDADAGTADGGVARRGGGGQDDAGEGIAEALGAATEEEVTSPTFQLVHEYVGPKVHVFHLDLYRLETEEQIAVLGIEEMLSQLNALLLVEWGERFESVMGAATAEIAVGQGEVEDERLLQVRWG